MSYGYQPSLPEIVVVSDKVMKLNVELRKLSSKKENNELEWKLSARELYDEIGRILSLESLDIRTVIDKQGHEIPLGRIDNRDELLLIYRTAIRKNGSGYGYVDFSYDNIQSRFACYHCLNEWRLQYERYINGELAWGNRHYISGSESDNNYYFAFISGYQKASNGSINIKLNIGDYAVHPDRKGVGGFRCKDKKPLGHNADSALMFTGDRNESNWEQFLILRHLHEEYSVVARNANRIDNYRPEGLYQPQKTSQVYENNIHSVIQYGKIKSNRSEEFRELNKQISKNFIEVYRNRNFVVMQRLVLFKNETNGKIKTLFRIFNSNQRIMINHSDLNDKDLGLFIFTKDRLIQTKHSDRYFSSDTNYQMNYDKINSFLGWRGSNGQLHRINPSSIESTSTNSDNYDGTTKFSSIDLHEISNEASKLVKAFKSAYPNSILPTISTSIKSISIFYFDGLKLSRIKNNDTFPVSSGRGKIFIRSSGFVRPQLNVVIRKSGVEKVYHELKSENIMSNFWSCSIPRIDDNSLRSILFIIDCVGKGLQDLVTTKFSLSDLPISDENSVKNIQMSTSVRDNVEILKANVKYQLKERFNKSDDEIRDYFFDDNDDLHYSELIKFVTQKSIYSEDYSLPINKLESIFPGLDELVFKRQNTEPLSGRFRSTGVFLPKETKGLHEYDEPSFSWSHFDEHIVKLSDEWHLLLTPKPLLDYKIEPDGYNVIVTNHGTFLRNSIPSQLKHIKKRRNPMFLDHISESPQQHINSIINLFTIIPENHLLDLKRELDRNFKTEFYFTGSNTRGLKYWDSNEGNNENWATCSVSEITDLPLSKYCLKLTLSTGKIVCLDILRVKHKMTNERRLIIRCVHENQSCDYLDIAKVIPNKQYMESIVPEWITIIKNQRIDDLHRFLNQTCSKYDRDYSVRAYDWHYIAVESLRSFVALNSKYTGISQVSHIGPFRTEISSAAPEPLRKYLLGGGKWDNSNKKYTDNMGGALNQPIVGKYPSLKKAFLSSIAKWIWLGNSD